MNSLIEMDIVTFIKQFVLDQDYNCHSHTQYISFTSKNPAPLKDIDLTILVQNVNRNNKH